VGVSLHAPKGRDRWQVLGSKGRTEASTEKRRAIKASSLWGRPIFQKKGNTTEKRCLSGGGKGSSEGLGLMKEKGAVFGWPGREENPRVVGGKELSG